MYYLVLRTVQKVPRNIVPSHTFYSQNRTWSKFRYMELYNNTLFFYIFLINVAQFIGFILMIIPFSPIQILQLPSDTFFSHQGHKYRT